MCPFMSLDYGAFITCWFSGSLYVSNDVIGSHDQIPARPPMWSQTLHDPMIGTGLHRRLFAEWKSARDMMWSGWSWPRTLKLTRYPRHKGLQTSMPPSVLKTTDCIIIIPGLIQYHVLILLNHFHIFSPILILIWPRWYCHFDLNSPMPGPRDASWSEIPQRNPTSIRKVELRNCFACNCCNCSCICFLCAWNLIASCLPVVDWQYRVRRRELEKLWQKFSFDKWCCCFRAKSSRHVLKLFESQTPRTKTAATMLSMLLFYFVYFVRLCRLRPFAPNSAFLCLDFMTSLA